MFDCVFPTRTAVRPWAGGRRGRGCCRGGQSGGGASEHEDLVDPSSLPPPFPQRFGSALVPTGNLQLKKKQYEKDFRPIDSNCTCPTCQK